LIGLFPAVFQKALVDKVIVIAAIMIFNESVLG
jgi:hypothetical protein